MIYDEPKVGSVHQVGLTPPVFVEVTGIERHKSGQSHRTKVLWRKQHNGQEGWINLGSWHHLTSHVNVILKNRERHNANNTKQP